MSDLAELKAQLKRNWSYDETATSPQRSADITSLANKLKEQTSYNNVLLQQLRELEDQYAEAISNQSILESNNRYLMNQAKESNERAEDLYHKLNLSAQLCDRLSAQSKSMRTEMLSLTSKLEESHGKCEAYHQKLEYLEETHKEQQHTIQQLEYELSQRNVQSSVDVEMVEMQSSLNFSLEKVTSELLHYKNQYIELQTELKLTRDENIKLQQRLEFTNQTHQSSLSGKDEIYTKYKQQLEHINTLQQETYELTTANEEYQQQIQVLSLKLQASEQAQEESAAAAAKSDLMWRRQEDLVKMKEADITSLQGEVATLTTTITRLKQQLEHADTHSKSWEDRVQEECDRLLRGKLNLTISHMTQRLEDERKISEEAIANSNKQVRELNTLLTRTRADINIRVEEANLARETAQSKIIELETIISELQTEKQNSLLEEREGVRVKEEEVKSLKYELARRGDRYTETLSVLQKAIRQLAEEAVYLKNHIKFISAQQDKLLTIMCELTGQNKDLLGVDISTLQGKELPKRNYPALKPLEFYGSEVATCFRIITEKLTTEKREHRTMKTRVEALEAAQKDAERNMQETDCELKFSLEQLVACKGTISRLQAQLADAEKQQRNSVNEINTERRTCSERTDRAETRALEMMKQNTLLQNEITMLNAELAATRALADGHAKDKNEKLLAAEHNNDMVKLELKDAKDQYSALQKQLMATEAKLLKQQNDYQKLRKISISLKDDLTTINMKHQHQLEALNKAIEQYQIQLNQKQQLIETLQAQRNEMLKEGMKSSQQSNSDELRTPHYSSYLSHTPTPPYRNTMRRSAPSYVPPTVASPRFFDSAEKDAEARVNYQTSNIRHLTATLEQMPAGPPFRVPALRPPSPTLHTTDEKE